MKNDKSIAIIVCYFGKLPDYFNLWLKSCEMNNTIEFFVFTDQKNIKEYPKNVNVNFTDLNSLKKQFENKLNMTISLENPFKICDFRPAFGIIFEDYLNNYDFWGHCDIDQIFGDIRKFLTSSILENYNRILYLGHLSLYRNIEKINSAYKLQGSLFNYKKVFTHKQNYAFDEITGSKMIFEYNNIPIYKEKIFADIDSKYKRLHLYKDYRDKEYQIFYWENGKIYRAYIENNEIKVDEFIYIHFQKKYPLNLIDDIKSVTSFYILNDEFKPKRKGVPSIEEIKEYSHYRGEGYERKEEYVYVLKKLNQFAKVNVRQKLIWLKQKVSTKGE